MAKGLADGAFLMDYSNFIIFVKTNNTMDLKNINIPVTVCKFDELSEDDRSLVDKAIEMTRQAYAPYSHFHVGAAIRLVDGTIVTGSNQENAAFPSGTCAERSACFYAGANYPEKSFEAIAVAARDADGSLTADPISPCGACRQSLLEYEKLAGRPVKVFLSAKDKVLILPSVKSLLPFAFVEF